MPRLVRHPVVLVLAVLVALAAATWPAAETTTTIILVRHTEKAAAPADDPPLTPEGEARAALLVDALRNAGINAVYSTRWKRTQGTAAPISAALAIPVTTLDAPPRGQAAAILARHRGQVVLVVGHSNTVPDIITALGIANVPPIADSEHDNLFVVSVPETGAARYVRAKYGR